MSYSQGRPVSDGEALLAGLLFFQPQYGKSEGQKLEKQETFDRHPRPEDGRDVLPTWRTLAVHARGLDQTNAWCCKRLVTAPPPRSTRRAEQNKELRRHDRLEKSNLSLDHQSGSWRPAVPHRYEDFTRAFFEATDLALEELIFGRVEDVLRPSLTMAASS